MTDDSAQAQGGCVALQPYRQVDVIIGQDSGRCQQLLGSQESRLTFDDDELMLNVLRCHLTY